MLARNVALPGKNGLSEIKDRAFRALTYPGMAGGSVQPYRGLPQRGGNFGISHAYKHRTM